MFNESTAPEIIPDIVSGEVEVAPGKRIVVRCFANRIPISDWINMRIKGNIHNQDVLYAVQDTSGKNWLGIGARMHADVTQVLDKQHIKADPHDFDHTLQVEVANGKVTEIHAPLELTTGKVTMAKEVLKIVPKIAVAKDVVLSYEKGGKFNL